MRGHANLIRGTRLRAGLTQAQLAERMGTTQTAIARLEGRQANPRLSTLDRALQATGHTLALAAVPASARVDDAQLAAHLRLTPEERLEAHEQAYRNIRSSVAGARRVR